MAFWWNIAPRSLNPCILTFYICAKNSALWVICRKIIGDWRHSGRGCILHLNGIHPDDPLFRLVRKSSHLGSEAVKSFEIDGILVEYWTSIDRRQVYLIFHQNAIYLLLSQGKWPKLRTFSQKSLKEVRMRSISNIPPGCHLSPVISRQMTQTADSSAQALKAAHMDVCSRCQI